MVTLEECKKLLGEPYSNLTDKQILDIRDLLTVYVDIAIEIDDDTNLKKRKVLPC